ncbi:MAG TPA: hypothetical protein VNW46_03550, partial [Gemmatimonadaceae bacterium]|nr:hypothetical protein [Gemmatimonadaceae bacterium]
AWLAGLVASVAYTDRVPRAAAPTDVAPLASLIDRVGPPSTSATPARGADPTRLAWGVFALLALALLAEWTSRRTRGVK